MEFKHFDTGFHLSRENPERQTLRDPARGVGAAEMLCWESYLVRKPNARDGIDPEPSFSQLEVIFSVIFSSIGRSELGFGPKNNEFR